jgi:hypothetical protein
MAGGEEAPVGLFDVARGAAAAFSRTAFPLRGAEIKVSSASSEAEGSVGSEAEHAQRVRKRDMVANAVTGGLASGLGWVLGTSFHHSHHSGTDWLNRCQSCPSARKRMRTHCDSESFMEKLFYSI